MNDWRPGVRCCFPGCRAEATSWTLPGVVDPTCDRHARIVRRARSAGRPVTTNELIDEACLQLAQTLAALLAPDAK